MQRETFDGTHQQDIKLKASGLSLKVPQHHDGTRLKGESTLGIVQPQCTLYASMICLSVCLAFPYAILALQCKSSMQWSGYTQQVMQHEGRSCLPAGQLAMCHVSSEFDSNVEHYVQHPIVVHCIIIVKQTLTAHHACSEKAEGGCDKTCNQMLLHSNLSQQ